MLKRLERRPAWLLLLSAYLVVALLGYLDYLTGDYSILIFYAVPVSLVAWSVGCLGAVSISLAAGLARIVSDYYSYSASALRPWNSFQDMVFLLMVGVLVVWVKKLLGEEQKRP
jgi:purine-cytosine permease-like protein